MGWGSGKLVADELEDVLAPYLGRFSGDEIRKIGDRIAYVLMGMDAELDECEGFVGDAASRAKHVDGAGGRTAYTDDYGGSWAFDGRRWRSVEPESEDRCGICDQPIERCWCVKTGLR